ncbi:MAG: PilZ domain-containing protein [Planctomycetota bacterium]|nr:PilZ domain-containing protein [Planctomycetota bacterium]
MQPPVIVRNSIRYDVCLRGMVSVIDEQVGGVRLTTASGVRNGWLDVDVVDLATGGLGFISSIFFPRRVLLRVRVLGQGDTPPTLLECTARVQRVCMTDRRPAYLMGCAFEAQTPQADAQLAALIGLLAGMDGH